jgi:hypothetical protein
MVAFEPGPLIERLVDAGVEFVIVGGFAVIAHGYVRATKDLDIVPAPTRGNYERLAALLRELEAEQIGVDAHLLPNQPTDPAGLGAGGSFQLTTSLEAAGHPAGERCRAGICAACEQRRDRALPSAGRSRVLDRRACADEATGRKTAGCRGPCRTRGRARADRRGARQRRRGIVSGPVTPPGPQLSGEAREIGQHAPVGYRSRFSK